MLRIQKTDNVRFYVVGSRITLNICILFFIFQIVARADNGQGLFKDRRESRRRPRCLTNDDCSKYECCVKTAEPFLGRCRSLGREGNQ